MTTAPLTATRQEFETLRRRVIMAIRVLVLRHKKKPSPFTMNQVANLQKLLGRINKELSL